jgi:small-conductance mechanosensitive channel
MINWAYIFLDNSILQWVEGLAFGLLIFVVLVVIKWILRSRARRTPKLPRKGSNDLIFALIDHTPGIIILWLAVFTFLRFLNLTPDALYVINTTTVIVGLIQLGLWLTEIVAYLITRRQLAQAGGSAPSTGPVGAAVLLAKITVWVLVAILILENIPGIHVTTLIASLGIGGIAIGLALQKILGDLFASLTISIDKPFVEGDSITVDQLSGTVEHIGLKSTRVRSFSGEELIFSNTDLLESRIHNYKTMNNRLVVFTLNISYATPHAKLENIPVILRTIIELQPKVTFNRAHFKAYDNSALIYEIVYTINTPDFNLYMDIQQAINLEIFRQFHEQGIDFAYPTQTIYLTNPQ